jgi:hypothetical protein
MFQARRVTAADPPFGLEAATRLVADGLAPWLRQLGLLVERVEAERPRGAPADWQPGALVRVPYSHRICREDGTVCTQALTALADSALLVACAAAWNGYKSMTLIDQTVPCISCARSISTWSRMRAWCGLDAAQALAASRCSAPRRAAGRHGVERVRDDLDRRVIRPQPQVWQRGHDPRKTPVDAGAASFHRVASAPRLGCGGSLAVDRVREAAMKTALLVASVLTLLATAAGAEEIFVKGNDTGGIIPWTCETESAAQEMAGHHCAYYGKYPRITSVHRQYGDYIAFACLWTPYIARFQIPGVRTRSVCNASPRHIGPDVLITKN